MAIFRCMADEVTNPRAICQLGGQGCTVDSGDSSDGVELGGVTKLRPVSYPMANVPTLSENATSEDAYGDTSEFNSDRWKTLVAPSLSTFIIAGCRTRAVDIPPGGSAQDIWGCSGVPEAGFDPANPGEPWNRPNDSWATCGYTIEGGYPTLYDRHCIPYTALYTDVPVTFRTDPEFGRLVSAHDGYCIGTMNQRCIGLPFDGNGDELEAPVVSFFAWNNIGVDLHQPRLRWHAQQTPFASRAVVDLSNEALAYLPGPGFFNLGRVSNVNNQHPAWTLNASDVWRGGFDALAPGGVGCAALPTIRTFAGRTKAGDCPVTVQWVPLRASYSMSMQLYSNHTRGSTATYVKPAIQFQIDIEMGCRFVMSGCTIVEPYLGGTFTVQPQQPCNRSLYGLNLPGDSVVVNYKGETLYDLPRYIRWRGEVGPNTGGRSTAVSAENGAWHNVASIGGSGPICCTILRGLEDFNIPAKRFNPSSGIELYDGSVSIRPNADGAVDAICPE